MGEKLKIEGNLQCSPCDKPVIISIFQISAPTVSDH